MATILVIDDSDMTRAMVAELLAQEGHRVETYCPETVRELYAKLLRFHPDLVVLDLQFNEYEYDGLDLMNTIREGWRSLPVILLTANRDPEILGEFQSRRVNAVLHKPEGLPCLHGVIESVLSISADSGPQ